MEMQLRNYNPENKMKMLEILERFKRESEEPSIVEDILNGEDEDSMELDSDDDEDVSSLVSEDDKNMNLITLRGVVYLRGFKKSIFVVYFESRRY